MSHREDVKDEADEEDEEDDEELVNGEAQLQSAMMKDEQHDEEDDEEPRRDTRRGRSRHRSRSQRRQFRQHHQEQSRRPPKPRVAPAGKHGFKVRFVDDPDQKVYNMRKGAIAECFKRSALPIPDWMQDAREKAIAIAEGRIPRSDDDDAHGRGSAARSASGAASAASGSGRGSWRLVEARPASAAGGGSWSKANDDDVVGRPHGSVGRLVETVEVRRKARGGPELTTAEQMSELGDDGRNLGVYGRRPPG